MYGYLKSIPDKKIAVSLGMPKISRPKINRRVAMGVSFVFTFLGLVLIGFVVWPIIQWQIIYLPQQPAEKFASPVPKFATPITAVNASSGNPDDFNNVNWVPKSKKTSEIKYYTLSIPKLKIDNATVEFGATDLKKSLIGWADSSLPGSLGNNIVFGHSALPQFYNPKDYKTIFSLLPTLKIGDEIFVSFDGISYKFVVYEMQTVEPEDYSVLEQRFDDSYLTLVTCVPPGTYWKRLVVRAKVAKF